MSVNIKTLSELITDFRALHARNSVTPESLGYILARIVEAMGTALSVEEYDKINARIDALLGQNASEAIDNFNEVLKFLSGVTDDSTLLSLLNDLRLSIKEVQRWQQGFEGKSAIDSLGVKPMAAEVQIVVGKLNLSDGQAGEPASASIPVVDEQNAGVLSAEQFKGLNNRIGRNANVIDAHNVEVGISGFAAIIERHQGIMDSLGDVPVRLSPNTHYEVVYDRSLGKFVFTLHGVENHPDSGDAMWRDWSAWHEAFPGDIPPYGNYYASEGEVRTDRIYRCGASLYRFEDGDLVPYSSGGVMTPDGNVDLSNYYTKKQVDDKLTQKADTTALDDKTDEVKIVEVPDMDTGIEVECGKYYRVGSAVGASKIILPKPRNEGKLEVVSVFLTAGESPELTIESSSGHEIGYFEGYAIEPNTTYELNIMFNGAKWIVAYGVVE